MAKVTTSTEAQAAIKQIQSIINGGLTEQITRLDTEGKTLSDPNVWDGGLARTFRESTWPQTRSALEKAKTELDQLRQQLGKIAADIEGSGGGLS